jgi:microcystin-dependent protein
MDPFLGEIRPAPYNFAPNGWAFCNGQILSIAQNTALFSLLGTQFGGNGQTTFALPDLRSRVPLGAGQGPVNTYTVGEADGVESVTLGPTQMAIHNHGTAVNDLKATSLTPAGNIPGTAAHSVYAATSTGNFATGAISNAGGGQPHDNRQPLTVISYIIAMVGIFPQRS